MAYRILVVDDEPEVRHLLSLYLESAGYEIVAVDNGKEALRSLEDGAFNLVILDIMLPEMTGWEVCRQIKNCSHTSDLPVIFLTARSQPLDRVIGLEVVHADAYLTKPFERDQLCSTINCCLNMAS